MARTGLHFHSFDNFNLGLDYYRKSGAGLAKVLVFDRGRLGQLRDAGARRLIGRIYRANQPVQGAEADAFLEECEHMARAFPEVTHWEGWNELPTHNRDMMRLYADMEVRRMMMLERLGKKAVIANFSVGQPQLGDGSWDAFLPAVRRARDHGHLLGLHEYGGPYMQYMTLRPGMEHGEPKDQWHPERGWTGDSPAAHYEAPDLLGWLCLRFRRVRRDVLRPAGLDDVEIVITESGVDNTQPRPGRGDGLGWRDYAGTEFARSGRMGDYAEQRAWYTRQLALDGMEAVDFGWGSQDPHWDSFRLDHPDTAMLERLVELEKGIVAAPRPTPRPRPPAPPPPRELPQRLSPVATPALRVVAEVKGGEGPAQFAGRAYGRPEAPYAQRLEWWRAIQTANGIPVNVNPVRGSLLVIPGFRVEVGR